MKKHWMIVLAPFLALAVLAQGCASMTGTDDDDDDANEQTVTMDQVPAAAKATLMKEAGNGKVEEIDRLTWRGKTVYEADVLLDGKKWEIAVREDGQLLKKQLDEETDDEDDKDDDKDD